MELCGKIVFSAGTGTDSDLFVLRLGDTKISQLTTGDILNHSPQWSPDGSKVAYISSDYPCSNLCVVDEATLSTEIVFHSSCFCLSPSWNKTGDKLIFSANLIDPNQFDVFTIDLAGQKTPQCLFNGNGNTINEPSLSPDEIHLCYSMGYPISSGKPQNIDIWECELNSLNITRLTEHRFRDISPRYSPNGDMIAFISKRCPDYDDVVEPAYQMLEQMLKEKADTKLIIQTINDLKVLESKHADLWVMERNDPKSQRRVTDGQLLNPGFSWSPDGRYICFSSSKKGETSSSRLNVVEISTGEISSLNYDREIIKEELGTDNKTLFNHTLKSILTPDFIEQRCIPNSLFGSDREPHWITA